MCKMCKVLRYYLYYFFLYFPIYSLFPRLFLTYTLLKLEEDIYILYTLIFTLPMRH